MYHTKIRLKIVRYDTDRWVSPPMIGGNDFIPLSRPTSYRTLGTTTERQMILKKAMNQRVICAHLESVSRRHEAKQTVSCKDSCSSMFSKKQI